MVVYDILKQVNKMFSHDSESEQTNDLSASDANSDSSELPLDKQLSTRSSVNQNVEILPATPDTPSLPATPASLVNHSGLLSPGLSSPGAQSTSSGSGGTPDPVHDLPPELLAAGWRRFWSRRENRPYFYNKHTTESRWEMPPLPGQVSAIEFDSLAHLLLMLLRPSAGQLKCSCECADVDNFLRQMQLSFEHILLCLTEQLCCVCMCVLMVGRCPDRSSGDCRHISHKSCRCCSFTSREYRWDRHTSTQENIKWRLDCGKKAVFCLQVWL